MQQCILCNKPTFANGFGAQLATYVLMSDALVTNVVNGFSAGSPLRDITLIAPPEPSMFDHGACRGHGGRGAGRVCAIVER